MGTGGGLIVIDFSLQGNSAHFRGEGWSGQEPGRVWGIGPRSVLRVPLQTSGRPVILEAEIGPCYAPPDIIGQIVHVRVNGVAVGGVRLQELALLRCEIDPAVARPDGILEIAFECPGFFMPSWLGVSEDSRPLSCWFSFVRLYTTDMFAPGPHFPASSPDIPTVLLAPPFPAVACAASRAAPEVYSFAQPAASEDGEANSFSVTEGSSGDLKLLAPLTPGAYVLRIDAGPLVAADMVSLPVTILLDGFVIGQVRLSEKSVWVMPVPRELSEKRDFLRLSIRLPEAPPPIGFGPREDQPANGIAITRVSLHPLPPGLLAESLRADQAGSARPIAVSRQFLTDNAEAVPAAIEGALGINIVTLLRGFETLGVSHEFGTLQRNLGLDLVNLFRFCNATLAGLTQALTDDLKAAADPDMITVNAGELQLLPYDLRWRTFGPDNAADPDASRQANAVTLGFLRRKFLDGLRTGRKIYVLQQRLPIPLEQAAGLLMELSRCGDATLLCVERATKSHLSGEVELLLPGLMRGYVGRFAADGDADPPDVADWLRMLANAALLKQRPHEIVNP